MKFNIEEFLKKPNYMIEYVLDAREELWEELRAEKFDDSNPEELLAMKTIWDYAFTQGVKVHADMASEIQEKLKERKKANE